MTELVCGEACIYRLLLIAEADGEIQDGNIDTLITKLLAPLIGVLIVLILLVLMVIIPLVSVLHLRMRYLA